MALDDVRRRRDACTPKRAGQRAVGEKSGVSASLAGTGRRQQRVSGAPGWHTVVLAILALTGNTLHLAGLPGALLAIATLYLLAVGVGAFFAALQTLLRDVEQMVAPALMMLQFLTPVLYPVTAIPVAYRDWFAWNPLTAVMQRLRDGFLLGATPQLSDLSMLFAGVVVAIIGISFFVRLSPYFEDFL